MVVENPFLSAQQIKERLQAEGVCGGISDAGLYRARWCFHLPGSLSRVAEELSEHGIPVALTTVLRWVKKAGEECVEALDLCAREDWGQPLCIDEKWVKVRAKWHYVFTAVGSRATDLLAIELFAHKSLEAIKTFLLQLKAMGFRPRSITTDLLLGYETEEALRPLPAA